MQNDFEHDIELAAQKPAAAGALSMESDHEANLRIRSSWLVQKWRQVSGWLQASTFVPNFLPSSWSHPFFGYVIAVLFQFVAVTTITLLVQFFPSFRFPEAPVLIVVLLVALGWGVGPSVVATVVGAALLVFLILSPDFSLAMAQVVDVVSVVLYTVVGLIVSILASQVQRARHHAETLSTHLETVIEAIPDPLVIYDRQGIGIQFNRFAHDVLPAEQGVLSLVEMYEQLAWRTGKGESLSLEELPLSRALRGETVFGMEMSYRPVLGQQERVTAVSAAPLRDPKSDTIEGAVMVTRDLPASRQETRRKRLQREREEARANELALHVVNRRMDTFIGIASHELKTPLTTIKGNLQLARRRLNNALQERSSGNITAWSKLDEVPILLDRAERQVNVLSRLVSDLVDVSRIQADKLELHLAPCDLAAIVREAVADFRDTAPGRTILMEFMEEKVVPVIADADRIEQVVSNYLSNALKYSETTRPVEVHLEVQGTLARVSVRDEGPGLSPQDQERIWERFYRTQGVKVRSGSSVGLGLGLHICRMIIEQHQGNVGVESTQGNGATFWFTLPLTEQTSGELAEEEKPADARVILC